MKKIALLILLISFSISVNAQQKYYAGSMYKDNNITAYIKERKSLNAGSDLRHDELYIKNNTNENVKIEYSFKCVRIDRNSNPYAEKMRYQTRTISPNSYYRESGWFDESGGNRSGSEYYVEYFSIINVKGPNGNSVSNTSSATSQNNSIPQWLIGSWYTDSYLFTVTDSQIKWHDGGIGDFVMVDGQTVFFKWRDSAAVCKVTQTSSGMLYHNSSTGSAYVVTKR